MFNTNIKFESSNKNYNIFKNHSASGLLCKSMVQSTIIRFDKNSPLENTIFSDRPYIKMKVKETSYDGCCYNKEEEVKIIVLQVLLVNDTRFIVEYITEDNFIAELDLNKQENETELTLKDLVSKHIINSNSVVDVYEQDKNDPHYSNRIFKGMAWEMEKQEIGNRKLKYIFSAVAESIDKSDRICIEVE